MTMRSFPRNLSIVQYSAQRLTRRRGMTLIEVCAVMAANAILIAVVLSALFALGRADRRSAERVHQQRGLAPLATRLRSDLHASQAVRWNDAEQTLQLTTFDDDTITYARVDDRWERRLAPSGESSGTGKAAGELAGAFPIPRELTPTILPAAAAAGEQLRIVWNAAEDAEHDRPLVPTPPEWSVTVGRDERLLHE